MNRKELEQILMDMFTGNKPRVTGEEADVFRVELQAEIDDMETRGIMVDIPSEWEVPIDDDAS